VAAESATVVIRAAYQPGRAGLLVRITVRVDDDLTQVIGPALLTRAEALIRVEEAVGRIWSAIDDSSLRRQPPSGGDRG
jgi:hypothetical protein